MFFAETDQNNGITLDSLECLKFRGSIKALVTCNITSIEDRACSGLCKAGQDWRPARAAGSASCCGELSLLMLRNALRATSSWPRIKEMGYVVQIDGILDVVTTPACLCEVGQFILDNAASDKRPRLAKIGGLMRAWNPELERATLSLSLSLSRFFCFLNVF